MTGKKRKLAGPAGQIVVRHLVAACGLRAPRSRRCSARRRLVVRRIAQHEHAVPAADDLLAELRQPPQQSPRRLVGQDLGAHRGVPQPRQALRHRQLQQRLVARADGEGIERGIDAEQHADRPAGDLRRHHRALRARGLHALDQPPPAHVSVGRSVSRNQTGRPVSLPSCVIQAELALLDVEVAVHAEGAVADIAERAADAEQLLAPRNSGSAPSRRSASCGSWCGRW